MTFLSVLTKVKKRTAEISKKILAIKNWEKSRFLIGEIRETVPKTKVVLMITDPMTSPTIIQSWDFLAAWRQKESSGRAVPKPTTRAPKDIKEISKNSVKKRADFTIPCPASNKRRIEKIRKKIFLKKNSKVNGSFIPS